MRLSGVSARGSIYYNSQSGWVWWTERGAVGYGWELELEQPRGATAVPELSRRARARVGASGRETERRIESEREPPPAGGEEPPTGSSCTHPPPSLQGRNSLPGVGLPPIRLQRAHTVRERKRPSLKEKAIGFPGTGSGAEGSGREQPGKQGGRDRDQLGWAGQGGRDLPRCLEQGRGVGISREDLGSTGTHTHTHSGNGIRS